MLTLHFPDRLSPVDPSGTDVLEGKVVFLPPAPPPEEIRHAVWIDLSSPLPYEVKAVEEALHISLPTRADMIKIEASSRVYREEGASFMTALLVVGLDSNEPSSVPVSFILTATKQLITVRYSEPLPLRAFANGCTKTPPGPDGLTVLIRMFELIVDRTADILERMGSEIDQVSGLVFGRGTPLDKRLSPTDLNSLLRRIGAIQFVVNKVHDSLLTQSRIITFLNIPDMSAAKNSGGDRHGREGMRSLARDITSLTENSSYLMSNVGFLLDAALGRISIEQNVIIKIFSIAAVVFLPPTLVGTVYGMNFEIMPELQWDFGYPLALVAMVVSGILPYLYFKSRGWL